VLCTWNVLMSLQHRFKNKCFMTHITVLMVYELMFLHSIQIKN